MTDRPANSIEEVGEVAGPFVRNLQDQIAAAKTAGVDPQRDMAVVVPAGYMALVFAMPMIDLKGRGRVALCSVQQANALIETLKRESGWQPKDR